MNRTRSRLLILLTFAAALLYIEYAISEWLGCH